jgi:hypothetical protein
MRFTTVDDLEIKETRRIRHWLHWVMVTLSIIGIVTFAQFIIEEAFQTVMFGTWAAKDAERWDIVKDGTDLGEEINGTLKTVTIGAGWVNPLAFMAYRHYGKAADYYILATRAEAFAKCPECFVNEQVETTIMPRSYETLENGYRIRLQRLEVLVRDKPEIGAVLSVSGLVTKSGAQLVLDCRGSPR